MSYRIHASAELAGSQHGWLTGWHVQIVMKGIMSQDSRHEQCISGSPRRLSWLIRYKSVDEVGTNQAVRATGMRHQNLGCGAGNPSFVSTVSAWLMAKDLAQPPERTAGLWTAAERASTYQGSASI